MHLMAKILILNLMFVKESCYSSNCDFDALQKQLPLLSDMIRQALPEIKVVTSLRTVCDAMTIWVQILIF